MPSIVLKISISKRRPNGKTTRKRAKRFNERNGKNYLSTNRFSVPEKYYPAFAVQLELKSHSQMDYSITPIEHLSSYARTRNTMMLKHTYGKRWNEIENNCRCWQPEFSTCNSVSHSVVDQLNMFVCGIWIFEERKERKNSIYNFCSKIASSKSMKWVLVCAPAKQMTEWTSTSPFHTFVANNLNVALYSVLAFTFRIFASMHWTKCERVPLQF